MGAASSTCSAPRRPSGVPDEQWILENVLFFDHKDENPNTNSPIVRYDGPCVKRFTPSRAKLRNRNFRVYVQLSGRREEFLLRLINHPTCKMVLCDKSGFALKDISTCNINYIQRRDQSAEVYIRGNASQKRETSSLAFDFENAKEAELFESYVRTLFGIQVHFFGTMNVGRAKALEIQVKRSSSSSDDDGCDEAEVKNVSPECHRRRKPLQARTGCPLHGNTHCSCNIERPTLTYMGNTFGSESSEAEEDQVAINARHALNFPVSIDGPCESGKDVKLKDIASKVDGRVAASVVEWFVAERPGKDPIFPIESTYVGRQFKIRGRYVGKYIKVRASRRLPKDGGSNPFVYSVAVKGPVTVDDETARGMLEIFTRQQVEYEVSAKAGEVQRLFSLPAGSIPNVKPFFDVLLSVSKQVLKFSAKVPSSEEPVHLQLQYGAFYFTEMDPDDLDERQQDLKLALHFPAFSRRKNAFVMDRVELCFPSEEARRDVFHTATFLRLHGKLTGFDRWARDLEMRNFSVLKSTYSRLWAETPFALFSQSDVGPSQEAAAAAAAVPPPIFDFSIDGLLQAKGAEQRDLSTQR